MADEPKPSQPSLMQVLVDNTIGSMVGPKVVDTLAGYALKKAEPEMYYAGGHPKHEREGSVESLIKLLGTRNGTLLYKDLPYLEQYLHPNTDILPKTESPNPRSKLTYREPAYEQDIPGVMNANTTGLGHYRSDPEGVLRLPSPNGGSWFDNSRVRDIWDFDTKAPMVNAHDKEEHKGLDNVVKTALSASGTPYGVSGLKYRAGNGDTIADNPTLQDREYTPDEMFDSAESHLRRPPQPEPISTPSANVAFYDLEAAKRARKPTSLENVLLKQMDDLRTR